MSVVIGVVATIAIVAVIIPLFLLTRKNINRGRKSRKKFVNFFILALKLVV